MKNEKETKIKNRIIKFFEGILFIITLIFIISLIILSLGVGLILIGFIYAKQENNYYDWEIKEELEKDKWSKEI